MIDGKPSFMLLQRHGAAPCSLLSLRRAEQRAALQSALVADPHSATVASLCCHSSSTAPSVAAEEEEKGPYLSTWSQTERGVEPLVR